MTNVICFVAKKDERKAKLLEERRARVKEFERVNELTTRIEGLRIQLMAFFRLSKQDPDPGNRFIANGFYLKTKAEIQELEKLLA